MLGLSERLRNDGVDAQVDQYVAGTPPEGWPRWMLNRLNWANFVLVICTETYYRRFRGHEDRAKGKGADWEGNLITLEMYDAKSTTAKFVPVLFDGENARFIPEPLRGYTQYLLNLEENYANLYVFLTGQAGVTPGELGSFKALARNPAEPLRFDVSDMSARQLWLSKIPDRNPFFTGREAVLTQLQEALAGQGRAALSGLGGVGKTQTVVEYAHRHLEKYDHIFFVIADSHEALVSGYVAIAGVLKLQEADGNDQMLTVDAVKRWLGCQKHWLLILDNADIPEIVKPFLPTESTGHILLTSREQIFDTIGIVKPVKLANMYPADAQAFLLKRTGREANGGSELNAVSELAEALGFLPLALEQAGAYIVRNSSLFQNYLNRFRTHGLKLLNKYGPVTGNYRESIRTTWSMNFRQLEKESEVAADLLRLSAFLSPDNILLEFLAVGSPELGNLLSAAFDGAQENPLVLDEMLASLTRFSLIRRQTETRSYSIHTLVQAVVRAEMDEATQRLSAERSLRAVFIAFQSVEVADWKFWKGLLPHVYACDELIGKWGFEFPEAEQLVGIVGLFLSSIGRFADAEPLLQRALTLPEKIFGPEHPYVARGLQNLAENYRAQGLYENAESFHRKALVIWEKDPSKHCFEMARSLNSVAEICRARGQYSESESLRQQAEIAEKDFYSKIPFQFSPAGQEKTQSRNHPGPVYVLIENDIKRSWNSDRNAKRFSPINRDNTRDAQSSIPGYLRLLQVRQPIYCESDRGTPDRPAAGRSLLPAERQQFYLAESQC